MRAAARAIVDQAEAEILVVDKVNALEEPYELAAEVIPATWTPEHVGKRIVEAFETLAKLPQLRGPKVPGNAWPDYAYDVADLNCQQTLGEREKDARIKSRNRVPPRPTAEDLRRMDIVFDWLRELHKVDDGLCRLVQRWAKLRALGRSIKADCRLTGLSFQVFYRLRDKGLKSIAKAVIASPVW